MDIEALILIYLGASKVGLDAKRDYVNEWTRGMSALMNRDGFETKPYPRVVSFICEQTKGAVNYNGWDTYDADGVSWFLALYSEAFTKYVNRRYTYDTVFSDCFRQYFKDQDLYPIYMKKLLE